MTCCYPPPSNTRVQRTRSSPSARHSPLTRCPLGGWKLPAGLVVLWGVLLFAAGAGAQGQGSKEACPASRLLPKLATEYRTCKAHRDRCSGFVDVFNQLLPKYDCRRSFDTAPVPAVWLASDEKLEKYVGLLARLKASDAQDLFGSEAFRGVLDGHLAEEYYSKSVAVGKRRRSGQ
jgi:hypothetical protein